MAVIVLWLWMYIGLKNKLMLINDIIKVFTLRKYLDF